MNQKYDYIIGIDPGVSTGFAVWHVPGQRFTRIQTCSILDAIEMVGSIADLNRNILVRIENPNLRKWFGKSGREVLQGAGSIKRDYSIWIEFLKSRSIPYEDVAPRSIKTKVSADYFKKLTGWEGRTSNHARDAALMVFKYQ